MFSIKDGRYKLRLHVSLNLFRWSIVAILSDAAVAVVVVVVRTRPRAIPLAMITTRKSIHGFPFLSYMSMGPFWPPELRYE